MNYEPNNLIKNADIVRFVKSKRMAWLGHVMWMEGKRIPKRVIEWKSTGKRNRGRTRKRWIEDIEEDIQIMGIRGWRKLRRKGRNGRKSLRRLKPTVGCNASKRRRWQYYMPGGSCRRLVQKDIKCHYLNLLLSILSIIKPD